MIFSVSFKTNFREAIISIGYVEVHLLCSVFAWKIQFFVGAIPFCLGCQQRHWIQQKQWIFSHFIRCSKCVLIAVLKNLHKRRRKNYKITVADSSCVYFILCHFHLWTLKQINKPFLVCATTMQKKNEKKIRKNCKKCFEPRWKAKTGPECHTQDTHHILCEQFYCQLFMIVNLII